MSITTIPGFTENKDLKGDIMEWEISFRKDEKFVEVTTSGIADKDGSFRMAKAISENMRKNKCTKALVDHRNISGFSGTILDIYERPMLFRFIGVILGIKIAEVIRPEHHEQFRFFETVCRNHGYTFSMFYDKDEALKWLL